MGDLSPYGEALLGTLISAKNAPFSASSRPPPAALIFTQDLDDSMLRLSREKGHFGDTWIARDLPKISGKSRVVDLPPSGETLFRTLIAAKNAPFSASFRPSPRGPDFYPKFGQSSAAISSGRGVILATHGFPMIFLKFWKIMDNLSPPGETAAIMVQNRVSPEGGRPPPGFFRNFRKIMCDPCVSKMALFAG